MSNPYREPPIDASYQVSVHLAKRLQRIFFRNQPIRDKNCLWLQCLLMDQNKMNNLYRGPSIDAMYQLRFMWQSVSEEKIFRNRTIRNKNCMWRPCLLTNRNEIHNMYRGPSIDAFFQMSVHLAKRLQRSRFFRNRPIRNKNCLWRPCL